MISIGSRLLFYSALLLSALLMVVLLGAVANFGFSQGPIATAVIAVMLLNPVVFGLVGVSKGTPKSHFIAAAAMLTLLLIYTLATFGIFGPLPGGRS